MLARGSYAEEHNRLSQIIVQSHVGAPDLLNTPRIESVARVLYLLARGSSHRLGIRLNRLRGTGNPGGRLCGNALVELDYAHPSSFMRGNFLVPPVDGAAELIKPFSIVAIPGPLTRSHQKPVLAFQRPNNDPHSVSGPWCFLLSPRDTGDGGERQLPSTSCRGAPCPTARSVVRILVAVGNPQVACRCRP
jgi:hypothetical protein